MQSTDFHIFASFIETDLHKISIFRLSVNEKVSNFLRMNNKLKENEEKFTIETNKCYCKEKPKHLHKVTFQRTDLF